MTETVIAWILTGGVTGWLGAIVVRGEGFGVPGDTAIGIAGGVLAGWMLPHVFGIDLGFGLFAAAIGAMTGAIVLLSVARLVQRI